MIYSKGHAWCQSYWKLFYPLSPLAWRYETASTLLPIGGSPEVVYDLTGPPSFYSSQGRITSFNDHTDHLLEHLQYFEPVGSIVVPKSSVAVTRNYDFDFASNSESTLDTMLEAYRISKPVRHRVYQIQNSEADLSHI